MPDPMTFVVAESYQRFVAWCREHKLNPGSVALRAVTPSTNEALRGIAPRRDIDRIIDLGGNREGLALLWMCFRA